MMPKRDNEIGMWPQESLYPAIFEVENIGGATARRVVDNPQKNGVRDADSKIFGGDAVRFTLIHRAELVITHATL